MLFPCIDPQFQRRCGASGLIIKPDRERHTPVNMCFPCFQQFFSFRRGSWAEPFPSHANDKNLHYFLLSRGLKSPGTPYGVVRPSPVSGALGAPGRRPHSRDHPLPEPRCRWEPPFAGLFSVCGGINASGLPFPLRCREKDKASQLPSHVRLTGSLGSCSKLVTSVMSY